MGYKHRELDPAQARAEITAPTYMLKILPGYDGKPRICEWRWRHRDLVDRPHADPWRGNDVKVGVPA